MLGPKTENSVTDSQNVNQIGHNSGNVIYVSGYSVELHEQILRERLAELRANLERAHGAERGLLQAQVDAAQSSLLNLQADYQRTLAELADLKATLARYANVLDRTKHAAAAAALDRGDRTLARALLTELSAMARARRIEASKEEAELEFKLGEIAAGESRWHDAAEHFAMAAQLDPRFETLYEAHLSSWCAEDFPAAVRFGEGLVNWCKANGTKEQFATALCNQSLTLSYQEEYEIVGELRRAKIAISEASLALTPPGYTARLGILFRATWSHKRNNIDTEPLFRHLVDATAATIGRANFVYCMRLNMLARELKKKGRYLDAIGAYREAVEIERKLTGKLESGGLLPENEHGYWTFFFTRAWYHQAQSLLTLLQTHFPDDPEIPALQALLAPTA